MVWTILHLWSWSSTGQSVGYLKAYVYVLVVFTGLYIVLTGLYICYETIQLFVVGWQVPKKRLTFSSFWDFFPLRPLFPVLKEGGI